MLVNFRRLIMIKKLTVAASQIRLMRNHTTLGPGAIKNPSQKMAVSSTPNQFLSHPLGGHDRRRRRRVLWRSNLLGLGAVGGGRVQRGICPGQGRVGILLFLIVVLLHLLEAELAEGAHDGTNTRTHAHTHQRKVRPSVNGGSSGDNLTRFSRSK